MKAIRNTSKVMAAVLALAGLIIGGCGEDAPTAPSPDDTSKPDTEASGTQISGSATIPVGQSGDLANARVAIYASLQDWQRDATLREIAVTGQGASVTFAFPNLPAGTYYLDVWKDVNNDGFFMMPDLYGWYGTDQYPGGQPRPILVTDGEAVAVDIEMRQMAPVAHLPSAKTGAILP